MDSPLKRWLFEVDRQLLRRFALDHNDAGWDESQIAKYFDFGMPPVDFVNWFAAKYDLTENSHWVPDRK
jgi:hypothetical protein